MENRRLSLQEYTVGWLCALPIELAAAQMLLDQTHAPLPDDPYDDQEYTLGSIGDHNVVIGCLSAGRTGANSAATAATRMRAKFRKLRFGLMVGVGGGVPSSGTDVRLGDVVISKPHDGHGGVIQYDFGRMRPDGFYHTGFLNSPPEFLLQSLSYLQARHINGMNNIETHLAIVESNAIFRRPKSESDVLFKPTYDHVAGERTCEHCDKSQTMQNHREHNRTKVHYGTIASGNVVMKNARERDSVSAKFRGVLCFEMEAAGLLNHWPCLVIRGICDYADSHKNDEWQPYAAGAAAAYAKELLLSTRAAAPEQEPTVAIPPNAARGFAPRVSSVGTSALPHHRTSPGRAGQEQQGRVVEQNMVQDWNSTKGFINISGSSIIVRRDKNGWTQLHNAAHEADEKAMEVLLNCSFNTALRDNTGRTPLHIAAESGHDGVARLLLKHGAEMEARNNKDETPLYVAASRGLASTLELFIDRGAYIEAGDSEKRTPLYIAARTGFENVVRSLLQRGANTETSCNGGWTPLHAASYWGYKAVVELLVDKGSDKNARNIEERTPLFLAAREGRDKVVELLLQKGAEKDKPVQGGWVPMHAAARYDHVETLRLLLDYGAYMEAMNRGGETPLFTAACNGQAAAVEFLLKRGAFKRAKNYSGMTPKKAAEKNGYDAVVHVLKSFGA